MKGAVVERCPVSGAQPRAEPDVEARLVQRPTARSLTILFTDIVGSTELLSRLGQDRWVEALRDHNLITLGCIEAHGGTHTKFLGDGWMAAFSTTENAVACAVALQRRMPEHRRRHAEASFRVRVGIHRGDVLEEGTDLIGLGVVFAARLVRAAEADEVVVSGPVRGAIEHAGLPVGEPRAAVLGGLGPHDVYPVAFGEVSRARITYER